jgi:hypothetical protein
MHFNNGRHVESFLQLKVILVGNFDMGCNFHIAAALRITMHYNLNILAIQEHTPWNEELSSTETTSISKHCDRWGYFVTISKLQIVIIDKQLLACHRETTVYEGGRIVPCRFEISENQYASFVPVYGVPNSSTDTQIYKMEDTGENIKLQTMLQVRNHLKAII